MLIICPKKNFPNKWGWNYLHVIMIFQRDLKYESFSIFKRQKNRPKFIFQSSLSTDLNGTWALPQTTIRTILCYYIKTWQASICKRESFNPQIKFMKTNKTRTISYILFALFFMFACINRKPSSNKIEMGKQTKEYTNLYSNNLQQHPSRMRQTHSPPLFTERQKRVQVQNFVSSHTPCR